MKALQRSTQEIFKPMLWTMLLLTPQVLGAQGGGHGGSNEWTNVGPQGGSSQLVTIDPQNPDVIYAATATGLFKSIDGGASRNNAGLNGLGVTDLAIDPQQPNILYAAVSTNRPNEAFSPPLFKSTDGGASWNQSGSGLPANFAPTGSGVLAIDPHNTNTLYAFGSASLFKSTDAGASWSMVYQPPDDRDFYNIVFDPNMPGTVYAASIGPDDVLNAVFKSVDGGTTWSEPDAGFTTVGNLSIDPSNPATLYTITSEGMYKTTDGAASWHALNGLPIQALQTQGLETYADVVIDPHNPNTLFVVLDGSSPGQPAALFKSTDAGASWHASGRIRMAFTGASMEVSPSPCTPRRGRLRSPLWRLTRSTQALYWPEGQASLFSRPGP